MINKIKNNCLIDFELNYRNILEVNQDEIEQAKKIIHFIESTLIQILHWLKEHIFINKEDEIKFFKQTKPNILAKLILYKEILHINTNQPIEKNKKIKYLEKKLNNIYKFYRKNQDFIAYIKSGLTYNDEIYFTRKNSFDLFQVDCDAINQDLNLVTSHDFLLAKVYAYELLCIYIENKIDFYNKSCKVRLNTFTQSLNWTAKKIDLVELIYALYEAKVFDNGNVDIKEIAQLFEKAFNIEIGDNITRSFIDIKNRKSEPTRFLSLLQENLQVKIDKEYN